MIRTIPAITPNQFRPNWMLDVRFSLHVSFIGSLNDSFLWFLDAPTIRMLGTPQVDLEEGKDNLVMRCEADANPPASIVWRRAGRSEIASLEVSCAADKFNWKT